MVPNDYQRGLNDASLLASKGETRQATAVQLVSLLFDDEVPTHVKIETLKLIVYLSGTPAVVLTASTEPNY